MSIFSQISIVLTNMIILLTLIPCYWNVSDTEQKFDV